LTDVVVDASTALAWRFPDESSDYADGVLIALEGMTIYDAAYLELSIRRRAPLATLDGKLLAAARQAGVKLFAGAAA